VVHPLAARPEQRNAAYKVRRVWADEAILSYLLGRPHLGGSWVFVTTSTETVALSIRRTPDEIEEATRFWLGVLQREDGTDGAGAARLYRDLLADALGALPPGIARLVVIPDGALHSRTPGTRRARHCAPSAGGASCGWARRRARRT
jgi:hypothetical protein